jgi:cation diffusion facilitator CzcD-associated flavoprotein CzcO
MILIVGAGPAGLAMAHELQTHTLEYQVLERHEVGYAWQNHYDRLHLHTLKQVSALPGLPMPEEYPDFPSAQEHHAYLQHYAQHFDLNIRSGVDVLRAAWDEQEYRWTLETSQGAMQCDILIAATGIWSTTYQPIFGGEQEFGGTILHARDYRNAEPFQGKRVLVVGAGNTGTEIAVDLSEQGIDTAIAIREGVTFVDYPRSPTAMKLLAWSMRHIPPAAGERLLHMVRRDFSHLGIYPPQKPLMEVYPVVGYEFPQAVEAGNVTVYGGIDQFLPGGVRFTDDLMSFFDAVIMATGYRPSVQFVAQEVDRNGQGHPHVDRYWRSTRNPNLYCVGYRYPATAGWLQTIGRVVKQVGRDIRKRLKKEHRFQQTRSH